MINHRLGGCALTYKHESYAGTHQSNLSCSKMTNRRVLENSDKKGKTERQKNKKNRWWRSQSLLYFSCFVSFVLLLIDLVFSLQVPVLLDCRIPSKKQNLVANYR